MVKLSESKLVSLVMIIYFVNILEFMIVAPLGADFIESLKIPTSDIGWLTGAYGISAAICGLMASTFVDQFDRKKVLLIALFGLFIGTAGCALATDFNTFLIARIAAGAFGGPATASSQAILSDLVPPHRRGKALGKVMGGFSIAAVIGVPMALEVSHLSNWRVAFLLVASLNLVAIVMSMKLLPNLVEHLDKLHSKKFQPRKLLKILTNNLYLQSFLISFISMFSGFLIIPNIATYLQFNLDYPRQYLGMTFMLGGILSFFTLRIGGKLVDNYGSYKLSIFATLFMGMVIYFGFINYFSFIPAILILVCFMVSTNCRAIAINTLTSKIPKPHDRASFLSIQNSVQNIGSGLGAFFSGYFLQEGSNFELIGIEYIAFLCIILSLLVPLLIKNTENKLNDNLVA